MLVALGAKERTLEEMLALLGSAGFEQVRQIDTESEFQILEAQA